MTKQLSIISSMATRQLLNELVAQFQSSAEGAGTQVKVESVGGVDAAKRVQADEPFDLVVLAANAIDQLMAAGKVVAASRVDLVASGVAVAVRAGAPHPDISDEQAVRAAVLAAPSVGYSTGPSGVQLARLFERWGIAETLGDRIVQAPPGVPVGTLVARGDVALGFQQLSELLNLEGIDLLGPLPAAIQIVTTFSGGVATTCRQPDAARALLDWLASPQADAAKIGQGMEPSRPARV